MEFVEQLLENPEAALLTGYSAVIVGSSAYSAKKYDFKAEDKTSANLEEYLIEKDPGITEPVQRLKARSYRKELEKRQENEEYLDTKDLLRKS